jgi:hypothetical protein
MAQTLHRMAAAVAGIVLAAGWFGGSLAYGAQINAFLVPEHDEGQARFMGLKFVSIKYPQGSSVTQAFNGVNERVELTAPLRQEQLDQVNRALLESNSPMQLSSANITYSGTIRGLQDTLLLSYRVELESRVSGYVLNQPANYTETILVDSNWRGFVVRGPVMIDSNRGEVNVNEPIGLLQVAFPDFARHLMDANAETREIMTQPILDFGDFGRMPLERWHLLFDPTPSQVSTAGVLNGVDIGRAKVLSVYSLGECSIREGCPEPREADSTALIDSTELKVHISTPQPNAQVEIAGYTTLETKPANGDLEIIGVSLDDPGPGGPPAFTMQVLLVLGGMMAAVAVAVLYKARK